MCNPAAVSNESFCRYPDELEVSLHGSLRFADAASRVAYGDDAIQLAE
jgi:hypothetical protein